MISENPVQTVTLERLPESGVSGHTEVIQRSQSFQVASSMVRMWF